MAALLSLKRPNPFRYGFIASSILSSAHFLSSMIVLLVYYIAAEFMNFAYPHCRYLVAGVLVVLAIRFFTKKEGETGPVAGSSRTDVIGLRSLAAFALILGFAHEEEFMLLALAVGGANPLLPMLSYAFAVMVSLVGVTLAAIKTYTLVEARMERLERHISKVTGIVLAVLASLFLLGLY